jgi:hypothetical protein
MRLALTCRFGRRVVIRAIAVAGVAVCAADRPASGDRPVERRESGDPCASVLTVHIGVPASRGDEELVAVLREEVERIWSRYQMAFDWTLPLEPSLPSDRPDVWVVTADGPLTSRFDRDAVAAIFFAGETPTNQIRLASPSSIIDALRQRGHPLAAAPAAGREQQRLVGRVLGRALAHELGHYLLASKMHDASGLMRGELPLFELAELNDRGGLALDASRLAALRARQESTCASLVAIRRAGR